jgi:hypothetical protein
MRTAGALLTFAWIFAALPAHGQTAGQTNTNAAISAPTPSIFPAQSATSRTCNFGCTAQVQACQNTCITTSAGTTVIPSVSTVGTTSNPQTCQSNCTTQLTACQRNCNLGP